jgi:hypothetical protein
MLAYIKRSFSTTPASRPAYARMHAAIDETLRLPAQQEWEDPDKDLKICPRGQTSCICTPHMSSSLLGHIYAHQ